MSGSVHKCCPKGHTLQHHVDKEYSIRCDLCKRGGIKAPENVWTCQRCDYDICNKCHGVDDTAPSAPPAPETTDGYPQATAPPLPTATALPTATVTWVMDQQQVEKCSGFFGEALRLESQAAEFDKAGKIPDALFHHRRAAAKLEQGLNDCPPQHPDKATYEGYLSSIQLRMVYLESLGSSPATTPLEDHIEAIGKLTIDVSSAKSPQEQDVSALLAQAGVSGSAAALTEEGYDSVAALKNNVEMKAFMNRILLGNGIARKVQAGKEESLEALAVQCSGEKRVLTFTHMKKAILNAPWVELVLDPAKDKLELAMELQNEATRLEADGLPVRAAEMYKRAAVILEFVLKRDPRMELEKPKAMVTARLEELKAKQADAEAQEAVRLMGSLGVFSA